MWFKHANAFLAAQYSQKAFDPGEEQFVNHVVKTIERTKEDSQKIQRGWFTVEQMKNDPALKWSPTLGFEIKNIFELGAVSIVHIIRISHQIYLPNWKLYILFFCVRPTQGLHQGSGGLLQEARLGEESWPRRDANPFQTYFTLNHFDVWCVPCGNPVFMLSYRWE